MKIGAISATMLYSALLVSPAHAQDWSGFNISKSSNSELAACQGATAYASDSANRARSAAQQQFGATPIFVHLSACKCETLGGTITCMVRWELTNWRRGGSDDG